MARSFVLVGDRTSATVLLLVVLKNDGSADTLPIRLTLPCALLAHDDSSFGPAPPPLLLAPVLALVQEQPLLLLLEL